MVVNPQYIHPQLWRASQLALPGWPTVASGHSYLDSYLPGGGWPMGSLIEIMLDQPAGLGELQLLKPALSQTDNTRSLVFLNPPYVPSAICLQQWFSLQRRVYWVRPQNSIDVLWAAENILKHDATAALLCWVNSARPQSLRRLHLAASQSSALFFCLRPASAANQPSIAPLRLALLSTSSGPAIRLLKRRGPTPAESIPLDHVSGSGYQPSHYSHVSLDQHPSSELVHG